MSKFVIALLISIGAATWFYTKLQKNSGNNTRQSLVVSGLAGLFLLIIIYLFQGIFY